MAPQPSIIEQLKPEIRDLIIKVLYHALEHKCFQLDKTERLLANELWGLLYKRREAKLPEESRKPDKGEARKPRVRRVKSNGEPK